MNNPRVIYVLVDTWIKDDASDDTDFISNLLISLSFTETQTLGGGVTSTKELDSVVDLKVLQTDGRFGECKWKLALRGTNQLSPVWG